MTAAQYKRQTRAIVSGIAAKDWTFKIRFAKWCDCNHQDVQISMASDVDINRQTVPPIVVRAFLDTHYLEPNMALV